MPLHATMRCASCHALQSGPAQSSKNIVIKDVHSEMASKTQTPELLL